ncbi:LysR family transcriptional regulator [Sabulicella rubraurantiaca]|uniref:LysR family transcriptional regulator n=1 Tax=Sabulicella rubraurantiaca TaxID=2811429 RepID=UPI001A95EC22|nr:LysR family transcriptional regulator [Sabulicella rubraurantiaca]
MDLRKLQLLRRVIEEGSFSRASAVLGITQPALSRQIRALEEDLGVALLYRNGRGVVATEEGRRFAAAVGPVLTELARIREDAIAARGVPRGRVSIAMPPSVIAALAPALFRHLRAELPEVQCHLMDGFTGTIHEWVSSGRVDIAVLNPYRSSAALQTEPFLDANLFLIHRPGDAALEGLLDREGRIGLAATAALPLLLPGRHHGLRRELDEAYAAAGLRPVSVEDVDSLSATRQLVAEGLGYTIAAWHAFGLELSGGLLAAARITEPELLHSFVLATSAERPASPAVRAVIRFLQTEVRRVVVSGALKPRG